MAPPPVNTPFRDPDFGSRMVRVTDGDTLVNSYWGTYFENTSFHSSSSGEENEWSVFDPTIGEHGGYRFFVGDSEGSTVPFALDATTMRVIKLTGKPGSYLHTTGTLPISGIFSYTNPDLIYGGGLYLQRYDFTTDLTTPIYNFADCPGLPDHSTQVQWSGDLTISGNDTRFALPFGGAEQDNATFIAFYDRAAKGGAGACYWYDTATGVVGGTDMAPRQVTGGAGRLQTPAAPAVRAVAGSGKLPAGSYYVRITALTWLGYGDGETTPSAEVGPIHLASRGSIAVTLSPLANPAILSMPSSTDCVWGTACGFNVYIGTRRGSETLQNTAGPAKAGTYHQSAALNTASRRPPDVNTAGYAVHDARMSKSGNVVRVVEAMENTMFFWIPGTTTVTPCIQGQPNPAVAGYCGGHEAMGYAHVVNATGFFDDMGIVIHPFSDLRDWTLLVSPVPNPQDWTQSSHWSWSDANPSDTMPVCGSTYTDALVSGGNGTLSTNSNPVIEIRAPWEREIMCVATTGASKVWRFAHDRATGTLNANAALASNFWSEPVGNVSPDGKFYVYGSDWEWKLGSEQGSPGCPYSGTCRTDIFIVQLH